MPECVLDASVLIAAFDKADNQHARATALLDRLEREGINKFVVLDIIANEVVSVLARKLSRAKPSRIAELPAVLDHFQSVFDSSSITWVGSEVQRLYDEILELVIGASGKLSFNDALLVLLQREQRIGTVATFDQDLIDAEGFQTAAV